MSENFPTPLFPEKLTGALTVALEAVPAALQAWQSNARSARIAALAAATDALKGAPSKEYDLAKTALAKEIAALAETAK